MSNVELRTIKNSRTIHLKIIKSKNSTYRDHIFFRVHLGRGHNSHTSPGCHFPTGAE